MSRTEGTDVPAPWQGIVFPFTWRGIVFRPSRELPGFWRSALVQLEDFRTADWQVQRAGSTWYARLRVGSDRFPGRGDTPEAALDSAAAEAALVLRFMRAMLDGAPRPAAAAPRSARKAVRR